MSSCETVSSGGGWLSYFGISSYVSRWIKNSVDGDQQDGRKMDGATEVRITEEDWADWEWVMSSSEEILQRHTQSQIDKTEKELSNIRGNSLYFRIRPHLLDNAIQVIGSLTMQERMELNIPLDSSKRSKVITDVIRGLEDEWRGWIKNTFFEGNETWARYEHSFREQQYSKNTVGILREVGWQASHGYNGTINPKVLADVTWSIWNALRGSIRGVLDRDLTVDELTSIAEKVCMIQAPLVQLWLETVQNSKGGRAREGLLVQKWQKEAECAVSRIATLRANGQIDGKYEGGPVRIKPSEHSMAQRDIVALLNKRLTFPQQAVH